MTHGKSFLEFCPRDGWQFSYMPYDKEYVYFTKEGCEHTYIVDAPKDLRGFREEDGWIVSFEDGVEIRVFSPYYKEEVIIPTTEELQLEVKKAYEAYDLLVKLNVICPHYIDNDRKEIPYRCLGLVRPTVEDFKEENGWILNVYGRFVNVYRADFTPCFLYEATDKMKEENEKNVVQAKRLSRVYRDCMEKGLLFAAENNPQEYLEMHKASLKVLSLVEGNYHVGD